MGYKKILWLLFLLLPAGAFIRIMQYYYAIDPVSGYFKQYDITITIMYVFIGICFLVFSLPLLKRKKDIITDILPKNNIFEVLIISVTAAIYIAYAAVSIYPVVQNAAKADLKIILTFLFVVLSAIFFGMSATTDERVYKKTLFKFVALSPIVFFLVRLVTVFNQLTMEANDSGYTLELIELASFVFFFVNYAKYTLSKSNSRSVFIFGLWSVLSVCIASIPSIILPVLPGNVYRQGQPIELEILYLFTGIFILNKVIKIGVLKEKL